MALIGHGSKLTIVGPLGTTTVNLDLDCISIDPGSNKVDTPESTSMLTPGITRTYEPGLEDPGDVTVKFYFVPGDPTYLALIAAKGKKYDYKIVYPSNVWVESFSGIAQGVDKNVPDDKNITCTVKIKKLGITTEVVPAPAVSSVAPGTGSTAGGTAVTINGTGFTGATAVKFGATNATSFVVVSSTLITAVAPAHTAATVDITVVTPAGTSATSSADSFIFA
jgi:hypothetical protein